MSKSKELSSKHAIELVTNMLKGPVSREEFGARVGVCQRTIHYYLHSIKEAGFNVVREKHSYKIEKFEGRLELEEHETSVLAYFLMLSSFLLPQYKTEVLCRVLEKILLVSNHTELINILKNFDYFKMASFNVEYGDKLRALEKYIIKKTNLRVIIKNSEEYYLKPLEFSWTDSTITVKFIDEKIRKIKEIKLEDIVKVVPKGVRDYTPKAIETIFELKGKLVKSYLLKEEERIIDSFDDKIVVANGTCEKEELFRRILKYGECAKVILPNDEKKEFKNIIDTSLKNLKK